MIRKSSIFYVEAYLYHACTVAEIAALMISIDIHPDRRER
jgi:hypothetical protein